VNASRPGSAIRTIPAEARPYQGRRAGIASRTLAAVIDLIVVLLILGAMYVAWTAFRFLIEGRDFRFPTVRFEWAYVLGAVLLVLYLTESWSATGRSYGARVLGLRIVDRRGRVPRPRTALLRAIACAIFPLGLFWAAVDRENRSAQDLLFRTSVIYDWEVRGRPNTEPRDANDVSPMPRPIA
jgi:uncharacterized RDD family membrane protein YckC